MGLVVVEVRVTHDQENTFWNGVLVQYGRDQRRETREKGADPRSLSADESASSQVPPAACLTQAGHDMTTLAKELPSSPPLVQGHQVRPTKIWVPVDL